jgi:hypothetical protein
MSEEVEEDLTKVPVQIATCSKCNGTVLVAVTKDGMSKETVKDFAKMMRYGCNVNTTNVLEARDSKWCQEPCEGMFEKRKKKKNT